MRNRGKLTCFGIDHHHLMRCSIHADACIYGAVNNSNQRTLACNADHHLAMLLSLVVNALLRIPVVVVLIRAKISVYKSPNWCQNGQRLSAGHAAVDP